MKVKKAVSGGGPTTTAFKTLKLQTLLWGHTTPPQASSPAEAVTTAGFISVGVRLDLHRALSWLLRGVCGSTGHPFLIISHLVTKCFEYNVMVGEPGLLGKVHTLQQHPPFPPIHVPPPSIQVVILARPIPAY